MCILMTVPTFLGLGAGHNRDVTHRCMPQISICRSPETEPPEPLETRTLVVRRIFDEGHPRIEVYADPRPVAVSVCATPLQRSCGRGGGECCSAPSSRGLPATTATTGSDLPRPIVLGRTLPAVEALALSADVHPSRYGRPVAARAISQVLGTFIEKEPASPRQDRDGRRDSTSD